MEEYFSLNEDGSLGTLDDYLKKNIGQLSEEYEDLSKEDVEKEFSKFLFLEEGIKKVRCNKCWWKGYEDELVEFQDEFGNGHGCPSCNTDEYLFDI